MGTGVKIMLNIDNYNRQTKEHHRLVSDFVLFPVDTGVLFKMLKTGSGK